MIIYRDRLFGLTKMMAVSIATVTMAVQTNSHVIFIPRMPSWMDQRTSTELNNPISSTLATLEPINLKKNKLYIFPPIIVMYT